MVGLIDFGATMNSAQAGVPDYRADRLAQMQTRALGAEAAAKRQEQEELLAFIESSKELSREPTAAGYADLMARFPKHRDALAKSWEVREQAAQKADRQTFAEMWAAGRAGRWDLVAQAARQRYDAELEAGLADDNDRAFLEMVESEDPEARAAALGLIGAELSVSTGDKFADTLKTLGEESRKDELHPLEVREHRASAANEEAEAEAAPDYYRNRARKEGADAAIAETDSAWRQAEKAADLDLKKNQVTALKSLIALRGKELNKPPRGVTVAEIMAPVQQKVVDGVPLSPGELAAWTAWTGAPASVRRRAQPATTSAAPVNRPRQPAPAPRQRTPIVKEFVNQQTGARQKFQLVGGKWVPLK